MTGNPPTQPAQAKTSLDSSGINRIIQVFVGGLIIAVLLFLSAGRLNWLWAWVYLAFYFGLVVVNWFTIGRKNPEVINERGRMSADQKSWDKVIMSIYTLLSFSLLVLAGLDAVRFGWSSMSLNLHVLGVLGLLLTDILIWSSMRANAYLSTVARIQEERGHQVVSTGPYRIVRHPMYVGMILMWLATPLFLGSWWGLVPGALIAVIFIIRTALEDNMLQEELSGYKDYAQRVRYRLLPGIW